MVYDFFFFFFGQYSRYGPVLIVLNCYGVKPSLVFYFTETVKITPILTTEIRDVLSSAGIVNSFPLVLRNPQPKTAIIISPLIVRVRGSSY